MKFKCLKNELLIGLNNITRSSLSKTTLPILEGVLIETLGNNIKLTTNDLEIGSEYIIKSKIAIEGKTVIDLKTFNEIIKKIESDEIEVELEDNIFIIKSNNGIFKLATMNYEEYTKLPIFNIENEIKISQKIFKDMIRKTVFSTSIDQNRPVYTGSLISIKEGNITVVAIDGFRMAIKKEKIKELKKDFKAIIPAKTLNEILKSLSDNEEDLIKIGTNKNQILFEIGPCTIISRVIEGDFLNYTSIIPNEFESRIKIKTKELLDSIDRVSIFSKDFTEKDKKAPIKLNLNLDNLELSCISQVGDAKESINIKLEGKNLEIGFNPRYLIEALRVIEDENIILEFGSNIAPLIIKPLEQEKYVYMVLPVKLKD